MVGGKSIDRLAHLTAAAFTYSDYIAGELHLSGSRPLERLPAPLACSVIITAMVRTAGPGSLPKIMKALAEPYWLRDETWGMGPAAEEGQDAMMAMFGPTGE